MFLRASFLLAYATTTFPYDWPAYKNRRKHAVRRSKEPYLNQK